MISVVIPTRNRASMAASLLMSLTSQTLAPELFEVLLVDNGSTDQTLDLLSSLKLSSLRIRLISQPRLGLHYARHKGLFEATGDIIVYADDDIEPVPSWLESINDGFTDNTVALMGGNNIPLFMGMPPDWLCELWNNRFIKISKVITMLSIQENPEGIYDFDPYMVWGCNFAIRKDVLLAAGGFHPDGMPEDLIRFRGDGETHVSKYIADNELKCIFDSRASVYHKVTPERMTIGYFRKRGFNQGVSDSYTHLRSSPEAHSETPTSSQRELMPTLKKILITAKSRALGLVTPIRLMLNPAQAAFQQGYNEGFAYHQDAYESDPEVRAWVHKATYFE